MNHKGKFTVGFPVRAAAFLLFAVAIAIAMSAAAAETPRVTDSSLLIGSCSALDGPAHVPGRQTVVGASAYLHMVNDEGGIFAPRFSCRHSTTVTIPIKLPHASSA